MGDPSKIDWRAIHAKLPYERTPEALKKRKQLFSLMDPNGNGYLSLAEIDKGLRDVLQIDAIFNAKPAIMRAYQAARDYSISAPGTPGVDYVERREFRILLQFLRHYFELWVIFETIDVAMDRRINASEFAAAAPKITSWGVAVKPGDEKKVFDRIDKNHGGQVLFIEFCEWAIAHKLDLGEEDDDGDIPELNIANQRKMKGIFKSYDTDGNGKISRQELFSVMNYLNKSFSQADMDKLMAASDLNRDGDVDHSEFVTWMFHNKRKKHGKKLLTTGVDWVAIKAKLPFGNSPNERGLRKKMFCDMDPNGNGYLSLAEVDKGLRDNLRCEAIFHSKPAIMRAFQAAKNSVPSRGHGRDYVQRREFRIFLQYLYHYFELWVMFKRIDTEGDRRISFHEFKSSVPQVSQWGVDIKQGSEHAVFDEIDKNHGGQVLFAEFCDWAIQQKLDTGEDD